MSDPPTTSSEPGHHHQQLLHLPLIHVGSATPATTTRMNSTTLSPAVVREYRKGNWTLQETMILITAKKIDDENRSKANLAPADPSARKGGELRWKWVENYCWSQGCRRSQNQCNDKWDNLLRDYKKVREYESRACGGSEGRDAIPSYWKMEKHERKENNLPSNMAFEVYQALNDVVQRKYLQRASSSSGVPPSAPAATATLPPEATTTTTSPAISKSSSGTESSEKQNIESKRRKVGDISSSIERSVSVLAQTLRSCEEQREIRHQNLMELHRRRLHIEETRNQLHRQGVTDLVDAVANLSAGIKNNERSREEGEEMRVLKEENEAMKAELMTIKNEMSEMRDQMPNLLQNMMHNMIHSMQHPTPTSLSQPHHHSMDPSGSGGDA